VPSIRVVSRFRSRIIGKNKCRCVAMDFHHEPSVLMACFLADLSPKMRGKCESPVTQSHAPEHVWNGSPGRSRTAPGRKAEREKPSSRASIFLTMWGPCGGWGPPVVSRPCGALRGPVDRRCRGWTDFEGPTLAPPRGRIVKMMAPRDWPANAWTSCPLMVAFVGT